MKNKAKQSNKKHGSAFGKFMKKPQGSGIAVILAAIIVFIALVLGASELFGSPISKIRAVNAAKEYVEMNMPGMDYERSSCKYDRETDMYCIDITPSGRKQSFRLEITAEGRVAQDGYTLEYMLSDIYE